MRQPRQVVFIMTDTQRTDMLGCYGHAAMKTPCLDGLAGAGIRFDKAYTCQPVCGPARATIFTGLWPHANGSWANNMALGDNVKTIGQRLQDQGVHCGYVGKWHLDGSDYFGLGRCPAGWDPAYWYDMRCYLEELTPEERRLSRDIRTNRSGNLQSEFTYAHRCSDRAVRFLGENTGKDFFLTVSYDEPHHPFLCPQPYSDMYRGYEFPQKRNALDTLRDKPAHHRAWAGRGPTEEPAPHRLDVADFLGCNSFVDAQIGRVLAAIDRHAPGALVIYTSDHGDGLLAHGISNKGPAVYDEIVRIPLLIRWPGHAPAAAVCDSPASHINLVPTILDAFGLPVPQGLPGHSMMNTIRHPATADHAPVFIEYGRYEVDHDGFGGFQPLRAVYDGRYKLAINLLTTDELYDLQADPEELINLIDSAPHRKIRDALHDRIIDWMNQTRDPFRGYYWQRRPWRTDAPPASWDHTGMTRQNENEEYEPRQLDYNTGLPMTAAVRKK